MADFSRLPVRTEITLVAMAGKNYHQGHVRNAPGPDRHSLDSFRTLSL